MCDRVRPQNQVKPRNRAHKQEQPRIWYRNRFRDQRPRITHSIESHQRMATPSPSRFKSTRRRSPVSFGSKDVSEWLLPAYNAPIDRRATPVRVNLSASGVWQPPARHSLGEWSAALCGLAIVPLPPNLEHTTIYAAPSEPPTLC